MSKFEGFFGEFKVKAKSVYGAASKAASEAADIGKVHYQIKQTQWEIEKGYAKLGSIVYDSKKGSENLEEAIALAVADVDALNEKLEDLEKRLRSYKRVGKCDSCSKENEIDACFCARCGVALEREPAEPIEVEVCEAPSEDDAAK